MHNWALWIPRGLFGSRGLLYGTFETTTLLVHARHSGTPRRRAKPDPLQAKKGAQGDPIGQNDFNGPWASMDPGLAVTMALST